MKRVFLAIFAVSSLILDELLFSESIFDHIEYLLCFWIVFLTNIASRFPSRPSFTLSNLCTKEEDRMNTRMLSPFFREG